MAFNWLFRPNRITDLKQLVTSFDPAAFIIAFGVCEVIGEGFSSYSEDAL